MTAPVTTTAVKTQQPTKTKDRSKERKRRGRAKDPASRILELQRVAGNRAVNQLIQPGGGFSLAPDVRGFMEARFNYDFSRVRVHTDRRAAAFSRSLGAQAYTVGHNIVFGPGQYDPSTITGRALLAHELAHVVQTNGRNPSQFEIVPAADATEIQAERAAVAIAQGGHVQISSGRVPAIRLRRDPRLGEVLEQIEATPLVLRDDEETLRWIWEKVRRINYHDPDNINPITEVLLKKFPHVVPEFLNRVEMVIQSDNAYHERYQRFFGGHRNIVGHRAPGLVIPLIFDAIPRGLYRTLKQLFKSAAAFITGLVEGISRSVSREQVQELLNRLAKSALLTMVFPLPFLGGTVVGIVEDVVDAIRGIGELITNIREIAEAAKEFLRIIFTPDGEQVAHAIGFETGQEYAKKIIAMLRGNIFKFTYDLGRIVGPMIVYTILAFLGVPALIAASIAARLISILRPILSRFPRFLRLMEGVASKLARHGKKADGDPQTPGSGNTQSTPSVSSGGGLPDIRHRFRSTRTTDTAKNRIYETTSGELGVPGRVQTHRDVNAQRGVSQGKGEDAGHRIGNRFGAPGGEENLAPQNWKANRFGTFKRLEDDWESKLKNGVRIEAEVTDITRVGENRPFMRKVKWTETTPDGKVTRHELDYANTHTAESRAKQNIPPTTTGQNAKVIDMEEARQKLRP